MEQRSAEERTPNRRTSNNTRSNPTTSSHIEASVTRLLVATKALLEGLVKWSRLEVSENDISRIYVQLGNDFNVACAAFARERISMADLLSVPDDLRKCLENCLSETASRRALDTHLPSIRSIIVTLLSGLKTKQAEYRSNTAIRMENDRREAEGLTIQRASSFSTETSSSRGTYSNAGVQRSVSGQSGGSESGKLTPAGANRSREDLRRFVTSSQSYGSDSNGTSRESGSSSYLSPIPPVPSTSSQSYPNSNPEGSSRDRDGRRDKEDTYSSISSSSSRGPPPNSRSRKTSLVRRTVSAEESAAAAPLPSIQRAVSYTSTQEGGSGVSSKRSSTSFAEGEEDLTMLAPTGKRGSVSSTTSSQRRALSSPPPPPFVKDFPEPLPGKRSDDSPTEAVSQEQQAIIAVLKSSDNLSRRASKRFSAYTSNQILTSGSDKRSPSKIDGSAGRELSLGLNNEEKKSSSRRKSRNGEDRKVTPKLPPFPSSSTITALSAVARSGSNTSIAERTPTIIEERETEFENVEPKLEKSSLDENLSLVSPTYSEIGLHSIPSQRKNRVDSITSIISEPPLEEFPMEIFLQIGSDVKKASLEERPSLSGLRELFIERFQYNPGAENFPAIYLRDPIVGVQYELEEITEIKSRSLISLKIDTMEQVKSHFDQGLSNLATEIKELKSSFSAMRRSSISASHPIFTSPLPRSPSPVQMRKSPGSNHFQAVTTEGSKKKNESPIIDIPTITSPIITEEAITPTATILTAIPEATPIPIANSLKAQHLEVSNLRHEISILKQVHSDFTTSTKNLLTTLRLQNSSVQNLASTKMVSTRTFLTVGLEKLDKNQAALVVDGDVVQDAIDAMKRDVAWNKVTPTEASVIALTDSLEVVKKARDELVLWLAAERGSWKETWRTEIARVVEEQTSISGFEKTLVDLKEDFIDATLTLDNIKLALKVPKKKGKLLEFIPVKEESEGDSRSAILLGIKAANSESSAQKRLEKIAEMEALRISGNAQRTDEFTEALGGFMKGGGLRKSGGIEETERKREMRAAATLKAMYSTNGGLPISTTPTISPPATAISGEVENSLGSSES